EGDDVRPGFGGAEDSLESLRRVFRNSGFVSFDDVHFGAGFLEFLGQNVARDFGPHQEHPAFFQELAAQSFNHRFGNLFFRHDGHAQASDWIAAAVAGPIATTRRCCMSSIGSPRRLYRSKSTSTPFTLVRISVS